MAKGIIVIDIPHNCFKCKLKRRPYGMSFPEDMICGITEESIFQYKPHNINGKKPEWCPIKEMPSRKQVPGCFFMMDEVYGKEIGFNDCLDEIEGSAEK